MKKTFLTCALMLGMTNFAVADMMKQQDPLADVPYFNQDQNGYNLDFDGKKYRTQEVEFNGKKIQIRAFEKIVYVKNPVLPSYQTLNFYVPEAYFNGKEINGFTAQTAPICNFVKFFA